MRRAIVQYALCAIVAAGWLNSPARAQEPPRKILSDFVACALNEQRAMIVNYVTERKGNIGRVTDTDCMRRLARGSQVRIDADAFTGIASAIILKEQDLSGIDSQIAGAPAIYHAKEMTLADRNPKGIWSEKEYEKQLPRINAKRALDVFGECVVRAGAVSAKSLFVSEPASPQEKAALALLEAPMAACSKDGDFKLTVDILRDSLASNYIRLAVAADPTFKEKLL